MVTQEKKPIIKKWWFWVICAVAALGVIGVIVSGGKTDTPTTNTNSNPPSQSSTADTASTPEEPEKIEYTEITAGDLLNAYEENEVASDGKYKEKHLKITGIVKNIGKDILDNAYITVQGEDSGAYDIKSVQCFFDNDNLDALSSLKAGDTVIITGLCDGTIAGINIRLDNCTLE